MQYQNKNVLDSDKIGPLLFKMALPAFIGMFVVSLYNVVNTIFIGHYVGYLENCRPFHSISISDAGVRTGTDDRYWRSFFDFQDDWRTEQCRS